MGLVIYLGHVLAEVDFYETVDHAEKKRCSQWQSDDAQKHPAVGVEPRIKQLKVLNLVTLHLLVDFSEAVNAIVDAQDLLETITVILNELQLTFALYRHYDSDD